MTTIAESCRAGADPIDVRRLGLIEYLPAWDVQRELAEARAAGDGPDSLLLLEHPDVYTAGRRTAPEERPTDGTPVVDVDRGGKITWHGPGQLVGYPLIKLRDPVDVVDYVRRLEQALIRVCADLGLTTGRVVGRSGVWLAAGGGRPERKVAAIGIRVAKGVTMHGFAINCAPDLSWYDRIVPCGIADAGVTSLSAELGRHVPVDEVLPAAERAVLDAIDGRLPVTESNVARQDGPAAAGVRLDLDPAIAR